MGQSPFENADYGDDEALELCEGSATVGLAEMPELPLDDFGLDTLLEPLEGGAPQFTCDQCEQPLESAQTAVCPHCGWYAKFGTYVAVDQTWEQAGSPTGAAATAQPQPQSHLQVWIHLLPRWAWVMIFSGLAIIAESIAVRLFVPVEGGLRTIWSLSQFGLGTAAFMTSHVICYLILAFECSDMGLLDIVLKPVKVWSRTFRELPRRLTLVNSASSGLLAAVMSILVIGAIPYERLWDWGFTPPAKKSLMGAVLDKAKEAEGKKKDLDEAVKDFAGEDEPTEAAAGGGVKMGGLPEEDEARREKIDCVILGYRANKEGIVRGLILGAEHRGQLRYACSIDPKLEPVELQELSQNLAQIQTSEPFVAMFSNDAKWVRPKYSCRVSFVSRESDGRLLDAEWLEMVGRLRLP